MAGERDQIDEVSRLFGRIEEQIKTLFKKFDELEERSTDEHRKVHDIVVATSEAVRNLAEKVKEMKPLTDDYRDKQAEARGAKKLIFALVATFGGLAGALASRLMEWISVRPHP